jgi:anthranilate 1,2-dioxygenase large subunit
MLKLSGDQIWRTTDYTRVPYWLFTDEEVYRIEQERIFKGPVWNFVGLEAELPKPGDFKTTFVGETPIIVNRAEDGALVALVNRCAHRGALVRREARGNAAEHRCIYHRWCYSLTGAIKAIPFRRGVLGKGGLAHDFCDADHALTRLRIASFKEMMFVSFDPSVPPLEDYLGELHREQIARIMCKPVRVLGFLRQVVNGNWKLYQENLRDTYHASLLHSFFVTFGLDRVTNPGGTKLDPSKRHAFVFNRHDPVRAEASPSDRQASATAYAEQGVQAERVRLRETSILRYQNQYGDDLRVYIACLFPNGHYQQMNNCLNTRQMIPKGPRSFEVIWTIFGYEDDDESLTQLRRDQANFIGPAGFVSMEDAEVIENLQSTLLHERKAYSVVEMGGRGAISPDNDNKVNEIPIRGFWASYSQLMGIEPTGAER